MNKISKRDKHFSCGIVVVRREDNEWKYLMLRSYNYWEPGGKGGLEEGEADLDCALRETQEETGLKPNDLDFKWGKISKDTEPYAKNKVARWFIAETQVKDITLPINPELGKAEHNGYTWANYDEASKLVGARIQAILDWAKEVIE